MLVGEPRVNIRIPTGGWWRIQYPEVAERSHTPHQVPIPLAVSVIHFDHPILTAFGNQDISVLGKLGGVGVRPVVGLRETWVERRTASGEVETQVAHGRDAAQVLVSERIPS